MRSLYAALLLLVVLSGCQEGTADNIEVNSDDTLYLNHNGAYFLQHMKAHFDQSLDYLFTSNAYSDKSVERPGMAKLLREQSDRHWQLGVGAIKKFLQRTGKTNVSYPTSDPFVSTNFITLFNFEGNNLLEVELQVQSNGMEEDKMYADKYLTQIGKLVTDSKENARSLNNLHRMAMKRGGDNMANHMRPYDAEMAHFLEEKLEEELEVMRKFHTLYTNFNRLKRLGLAVHYFDTNI